MVFTWKYNTRSFRLHPFAAAYYCVLILLGSCKDTSGAGAASSETTTAPSQPIFEKVSTDTTGITFENRITEDLSSLENLFNYDYFYNGAGAGVADLNNDGLLDVFFCGNQVPNKLFFNKGDIRIADFKNKAFKFSSEVVKDFLGDHFVLTPTVLTFLHSEIQKARI